MISPTMEQALYTVQLSINSYRIRAITFLRQQIIIHAWGSWQVHLHLLQMSTRLTMVLLITQAFFALVVEVIQIMLALHLDVLRLEVAFNAMLHVLLVLMRQQLHVPAVTPDITSSRPPPRALLPVLQDTMQILRLTLVFNAIHPVLYVLAAPILNALLVIQGIIFNRPLPHASIAVPL